MGPRSGKPHWPTTALPHSLESPPLGLPQRTAESALLWIHVPQGEGSSGGVRRRRRIANRNGAPSFVARGDEGIVGGRCGREARIPRGGTGECSVRGFVGGSVRFVTSGMERDLKYGGRARGEGIWMGQERDGGEGGSGQRPELALVPERDGGVAACRIEPGDGLSVLPAARRAADLDRSRPSARHFQTDGTRYRFPVDSSTAPLHPAEHRNKHARH